MVRRWQGVRGIGWSRLVVVMLILLGFGQVGVAKPSVEEKIYINLNQLKLINHSKKLGK